VSIQVTIPDQAGVETPVPGVRLTLLPYDRDSLIKVLENRAPSPRPSTARLDSLLQQFRDPLTSYLRVSWDVQRLTALVDTTRARNPGSGQDESALMLRRLEDSLTALTAARETARQTLAKERERLQPDIEKLRAAVRAWEDTAFRTYDSITASITSGTGDDAVSDSTMADGWSRVKLPRKGPWWVYARAVNVLDPNAEWYWNVLIAGDSVHLSPRNGRSRTRF
jgi:hypothetical protein